MPGKTLIAAIAASVAAALAVGAVVWFALAGDADKPAPVPTAAPTATMNPGTQVTPVDREGQAADGGDHDPLRIPDGIAGGIGGAVPVEQLTQPGTPLSAGDLVIANLYQSDATADPYVLLMVDEFTEPLTGEARAAAFQQAGMIAEDARVVQRVTLRVRQIAGSGDMTRWNLAASVVPVNLKLEPMTAIDIPADGCGPVKAPLSGHDGATNDTVQVCLYVFGAVNTPGSPIGSMLVKARLGETNGELFIQSDKALDPGVGDAHQHAHDEQWWKVDPETGLPVVDPETGEVVPAEGHDHDH